MEAMCYFIVKNQKYLQKLYVNQRASITVRERPAQRRFPAKPQAAEAEAEAASAGGMVTSAYLDGEFGILAFDFESTLWISFPM